MSSTISVVQYHQANSSPQKLNNVLQQCSQNTVAANPREIIILRKPAINNPPVGGHNAGVGNQEILITNPGRKKYGSKINNTEKSSQPPPVAVARRNARERNRVKQVNNGFATLRQHIPNFIAAAFESANGRGGSKKLSKVETLRMAVEYIRSLEDILSGANTNTEDHSVSEITENVSTSSISASSYISSTPSSPALTTATASNLTYTYAITSPSIDEDDLSTNPTPPPNYTNRNYQLISTFYEDNENLEPLDDNILSDPSLTDLELGNQDLSLLNSMHTTGSLSPEMYSDDSLSPIRLEHCTDSKQLFIPVFNNPNNDDNVSLRISPEILQEIKTEPLEEDSKENMIQVMAWWEQQQSRS